MTDVLAKLDEFIKKVDHMKKDNKLDLSSDQDLSIAIMNLISIEEHFVFSGGKTGNATYYDLVKDVREMRKELLQKLVKNPQGEEWCISKHLLAAAMRLIEVGTKLLARGNREEAYELFSKSYNLYTLFWGINMHAIDLKGVEQIPETALDKSASAQSGLFQKLGKLVKKAVDCCLE